MEPHGDVSLAVMKWVLDGTGLAQEFVNAPSPQPILAQLRHMLNKGGLTEQTNGADVSILISRLHEQQTSDVERRVLVGRNANVNDKYVELPSGARALWSHHAELTAGAPLRGAAEVNDADGIPAQLSV